MTSRKILVVDDEPHVIRILRLMLEREGYVVASANDGNEALDKMVDFVPDVLITDIQMDGMDGRALCGQARARFSERHFLILVMTSMTAIEERSWVRSLADTEFLEKPLSPRQLVARLGVYFASSTTNPEVMHAKH